jgi:hypothetical protein
MTAGETPDTRRTDGHVREALTADTIFDLLSNGRRRRLLRQLRRRGGAVAFKELYERLAAQEVAGRSSDEATVGHKDRKRVYVSLRQTHLPRLVEAGVLEYDDDAKTVTTQPPVEPLWDVLDRAEQVATPER